MGFAERVYANARAIVERIIDDGVQVLLQVRDKPGQRRQLEFPGGQVETNEPLLDALCREVREETGLEVTEIEGRGARVVSGGEQAVVECVQPFAAYQTLHGPVASMGLYFRCHAHGVLRPQDGETGNATWYPIDELQALLDSDVEKFSWVDRAGLAFYLHSNPAR